MSTDSDPDTEQKLGGDGASHPPRVSRCDRLAYLIDQLLSKRWSQCVALCCFGLVQVAIFGLIYAAVWKPQDGDPRKEEDCNRFVEGIWEAWTFMADPGTHSKDFMPEQRVVGAIITVGGIIFFASILGVVVDVIREKMESLRQGRSNVIEREHCLILGFTDKTILLIMELCIANESEKGGVVVVLAPEGKEEMEHELALQLPVKHRRGTKVVFRSGSPLLIGDLVKVSAHMAKAIVVLASGGEAEKADADTLRCILSLRSMQYSVQGHIVAEVRDIDNEPLVKLVGGSSVETLVSHDVLGRLMLMSARQPGLAKVYEALLGFDGDEFYMQAWPEVVGKEFGELMGRFPDAIPIGIRSSLGIQIKPSSGRIIAPDDEIIVIAEDNDTYKPEAPANIAMGSLPEVQEQKKDTEKILFCGWRRDIRDIMQHLDHLAKKGTEVHMMTHCVPVWQRDEKLIEEGLDVKKLRNVKIVHEEGNTNVRRKLEALPIETFTSCMIFADQAYEADTMHADSHSLATLLLIRDIQAERNTHSSDKRKKSLNSGDASLREHLLDFHEETAACPIICEILDPRTQKTIAGNKQVSLSSDFCQSNRLIAQVVAMISEERSVKLLLDELLGVSGCNVHMYPASRYCHPGEQCSFWTLASRAAKLDEIAIGYQEKHSIEKTVLNPRQKDLVMDWSNYDVAVIAGEDEEEKAAIDEDWQKDGMQSLLQPESHAEAWRGREQRSNLRESAREMSQNRSSNKEAVVSPHQVLLHADEDSKELLTTLLDSCSGMNDGERARFGQALDMMKQLVWNVSEKNDGVELSTDEDLASREPLNCCKQID
mmetsp:Transcript_58915/g.103103  ORF Transcript_58915/g.103103 Transcript_58915/m.103103 type:complete len:825 (+) Transcript_58915:103-2577(+)